jgi:hypothetical protein
VTLKLPVTHKSSHSITSTFHLASSIFYSHLWSFAFSFLHVRTAYHTQNDDLSITPNGNTSPTTLHNMYTKLFIASLFTTSLAAPLVDPRSSWAPADGTKTTCSPKEGGLVGLYEPTDYKELINAACAQLMQPCAYKLPQYLAPDQPCTSTMDFLIKTSKSSTQTASVLDKDGNKVSGKKLQCKSLY